jgi:hypothetical protein
MSVCRGARDLTFQYPCSCRFPPLREGNWATGKDSPLREGNWATGKDSPASRGEPRPHAVRAYRLASVRQDSADAASNRVSRRDKHGNEA